MSTASELTIATSVIIPALNEEESLARFLADFPRDPGVEIIVVDNGSSDGTAEAARSQGARVVFEARRGYGYACAAGVDSARGGVVVFMDADGANDPADLPRLVAPVAEGRADLVLGSRLEGEIAPGAMPWHQRFGNWLAAQLIARLYGLPITDLGPLRAVRREKLLELTLTDMTFGWPTEMLAKAARLGWRIQEVPVRHRPRLGGRSKISGTLRGTVLATYHILAAILRYAG